MSTTTETYNSLSFLEAYMEAKNEAVQAPEATFATSESLRVYLQESFSIEYFAAYRVAKLCEVTPEGPCVFTGLLLDTLLAGVIV